MKGVDIMFWKKEYEYDIIEDVDIEVIKKYLKDNSIYVGVDDISSRWCAFAHWYGYKNGFNIIQCGSFGNMVSIFMTGMSCSCGTEEYYYEETIEKLLYKELLRIKKEYISELEKVVRMFNFIFKFYMKNDRKYERASNSFCTRISYSEHEKFMRVKGENKSDKFRELLNYYYENH